MSYIVKQTSIIFAALVLSVVPALGFGNIIEKGNLAPQEANAQSWCNSAIEITEGTSGPFTASVYNNFTGGCVTGYVVGTGGAPAGTNFDMVYMGQQWCSNGWSVPLYETTSYDARNVDVTTPVTFTVQMQAETDSGGECEPANDYVEVTIVPDAPAPVADFTVVCPTSSTTIQAGDLASFNFSTTPQNGFNSPVSFSHSMSPASGTVPTISYQNNNQVPPATTTANVTTVATTTPATYTIVFTGTGDGVSKSCNVSLTVTPGQTGQITLDVSPTSADVYGGYEQEFGVTATCTGGATGPVYNLTASSAFANLTYDFYLPGGKGGRSSTLTTSVACGSTVVLVVGNTGAITSGQYSTPQARLGQSLIIRGTAP
jgi:hypothetical protein